ncbi:MAG: hypothetical protein H8M99_00800, partial [Gloeobacteraceae cyanobacterium ES-bin-144]|nr:hypothetical protein [Verrucomicrobiales bacterium]
MTSDLKNSTNWPSLRREGIAAIGLLMLICLLVWPSMRVPLVLDDWDHVAYVSMFSSWRDCFGVDAYALFRPIKNVVYYGLRDLPIFQWHAINLSVYLAATLSVYLLMRRLLGSWVWAFCIALLWSTSPTQVSTAVWMAAVNLSLAVVLTCACLYFHDLSGENPRQSRSRMIGLAALSALFLLMAETSYETAICVPGLCVLMDALKKRAVFSRNSIIRYAVLGSVTLAYLAIRSHFGSTYSLQARNAAFAPDIQNWQLVLSAPWFLWKHFSMWFMPLGRLEFLSSYLWGVSASPLELAAAWIWLAVLLGTIFLTWRRMPWVAFGFLWFLISSFPSSNFIPIRSGPIADYYLVFPGIGLAVALAGFARALLGWMKRNSSDQDSHRPLIAGAILFLVGFWRLLCIPMFWLQTSLWNRPLDLYLSVDLTRPAQFHAQSLA